MEGANPATVYFRLGVIAEELEHWSAAASWYQKSLASSRLQNGTVLTPDGSGLTPNEMLRARGFITRHTSPPPSSCRHADPSGS
jgi:hypothetical protein